MRESWGTRLSQAGERLRVRSALNPALWLSAIVTVPVVFAAIRYVGGAPPWLIVLAYLPVSTAVLGFIFLLFFDRDKLQSEDYQLRKQSLDLIQQKGDAFPVSPTSLDAIANPERPRLAPGTPEEDR